MGSYLSEPECKKESTDEENDKLKCGASSMQGWRVTQEDAHNCILDYENNSSFFAVYDGHGGHEVAQYCSQKLPQFIKELQQYKDGDFENALIEGFLGFDATIVTKEVIDVLKEIAGDKEAEDEDDEENVDNLFKEATMPIEKVIEKYTNLAHPAIRNVKKDEKLPKSPNLKSKKDSDVGCSSTSEAGGSGCRSADKCNDGVTSSSSDSSEAKSTEDDKEPNPLQNEANGSSPVPEIKITSPDSSDDKEAIPVNPEETPEAHQNGDISESAAKTDVTSSSPRQENGDVSKKGKGKALLKKSDKSPKGNTRPIRKANQLYKKLLDTEDSGDEESEDEEDKTYEGSNGNLKCSSDDDEEEGLNVSIEDGSEEESSSDDDGDEDDEEDEEDDEYDECPMLRNMKEDPGSDSGCTAVVAFLKGNELYVANAGDSRCIVCRQGKAIEMSFDHKPEDQIERDRVVKAGGRVSSDGRVNGGLNLSRAIGDHAYKQNKELSDKEQMITALPDIKKLTLNPAEDEFMVLACDGIWNFMSSQEVVDFVASRIKEVDKLSLICEEIFDHCLAPSTLGDGTGCDNMTAIIVQFKSSLLKRAASPELNDAGESTKRQKTDDSNEQK